MGDWKTFKVLEPVARVEIVHSFRPSQFDKLARHPAVAEIENVGMDEGCFFVHLREGFEYAPNGYGHKGTMSFTSLRDAWREVRRARLVGNV